MAVTLWTDIFARSYVAGDDTVGASNTPPNEGETVSSMPNKSTSDTNDGLDDVDGTPSFEVDEASSGYDSVLFTGASEAMEAAWSTALTVGASGFQSMAVIVKFSDLSSDSMIIGTQQGGSNANRVFIESDNGATNHIAIRRGFNRQISTAPTLSTGTWYLIVFEHDASDGSNDRLKYMADGDSGLTDVTISLNSTEVTADIENFFISDPVGVIRHDGMTVHAAGIVNAAFSAQDLTDLEDYFDEALGNGGTSASAEAASASMSGEDPSISIAPAVENAALVLAALDATVTTESDTNAAAEAVELTLSGEDAQVAIAASSAVVDIVLAALDATISTDVSGAAEVAAAVLAALQATTTIDVSAENVAVVLQALDPTVETDESTNAPAEAAELTLSASDAVVSIAAGIENVTITLSALDAQGSVTVVVTEFGVLSMVEVNPFGQRDVSSDLSLGELLNPHTVREIS